MYASCRVFRGNEFTYTYIYLLYMCVFIDSKKQCIVPFRFIDSAAD